jgi:hypothetical protein
MESKSSHRSSITKGTKKTTKGTKISLALLCAFCDSSFASFVILPHHSRPQQCINDATKSFSFLCFFGGSAVWRFGYLSKAVTTAARLFKAFLCAFASLREKSPWHDRCEMRSQFRKFWKGKLNMKTVVSFLLGAVMLFGAATLGLQSASANDKDKHDKNYWRHHRHHRRHHRHRKNHLSY